MGKRHQARELAVKVLFHLEFSPGDPNEGFDLICENLEPSASGISFSRELVVGVWENKETLDRLITGASEHWRVERMPYVDRNVLRIALFEVFFLKDIPPKVSIDEAVELGKKFGSEDSGAFINGILDNIYHR